MSRAFVPLCMTAEELAAWREANLAISAASSRARRPCSDCPASFAVEMRAVGLCNGAMRKVSTTTDPRRLQQWRDSQARRRAGIRLRRTPAEVAALTAELREMVSLGSAIPAVAKRMGIDASYARELISGRHHKRPA